EARELDQIAVAGVVPREQREVGVALLQRATVVGDVDLAADEGLHAVLAGLPVELDRAGEGAVVGEPHGGHLELRGALGERRDAAGAVEDRILGVDVKVDEGRLGHRGGVYDPVPTGPARDALSCLWRNRHIPVTVSDTEPCANTAVPGNARATERRADRHRPRHRRLTPRTVRSGRDRRRAGGLQTWSAMRIASA